MTFEIIQRFPHAGTWPTPEKATIETLFDLLNIAFIQKWTGTKEYVRLTIAYRKCGQHLIVYESTTLNVAIAFIKGDDCEKLGLPEFDLLKFGPIPTPKDN